MGPNGRAIRIASLILTGIGVVLLSLNLFVDNSLNVALPLVFLMLGGATFILVFALRDRYPWTPVLYILGALLGALGLVLLLNVLTGDWNAWAYAWLLPLAAAGAGALLAGRELAWWSPEAGLVSLSVTLAGLVLFAVFGAVAGGLFIQIMAPILLIAGGLALRFLPVESVLPERVLGWLGRSPARLAGQAAPDQAALVEPLSTRELEVLRLVAQGFSNQQIASRLSVATSTVKTHINNIYGKLGVQSRTQAVARARQLGLISGD